MKESEVRGSKRQGGGDERHEAEAELAESGSALERRRLRSSSRPKGVNWQNFYMEAG